MKKTTIMQILMMLLLVNGFIPANAAVTNEVEEVKTCSKCNGSGQVIVYEKCKVCDGRGLTTRTSRTNLRGNIECNATRCTACGMSPKLGMVKRSDTCPVCNGERKVKTGKIITKITYTAEEKRAMAAKRNAKKESVAQRNKRITAEAELAKKLAGLKKIRDAMDTQWKKLTLKDDTPENREKKMYLRNRIKQYDEEIKKLEMK